MRDWKLLEYFEDSHLELYNLEHDLGESRDLAAENTQQRDELHRRLVDWQTKVGRLPTPNADLKR